MQNEDESSRFGKRNRYHALTAPNLTVFDDYEKNF